MDTSRFLQIMYCESNRNGSYLRYTNAIECDETNRKFEQLEKQFELWQSEQN